MNGVRVAVHQSSSLSDRRKLVSMTRSPSVAVVSEMAPRWITPSSLRPSSQANRSPGATTSASWRLPRLRHLSPVPSTSLSTISARPASLRLATTFDPMNPAPPVTNNIRYPRRAAAPPLPFAPARPAAQLAGAGAGPRRQPDSRAVAGWQGPGVPCWTGKAGQARHAGLTAAALVVLRRYPPVAIHLGN